MKWKVNEEKVLRNIFIISSIVALSLLAHKIGVKGISWISTIGYFG